MDEEQLRLEYWEDNRTNPAYPLWIIFKWIGHSQDQFDGLPYLRHSQRDLPALLKTLETHPLITALADDLAISEDELRASLWFTIWHLEHIPAPESWTQWNRRLDKAWSNHTLNIFHQRSPHHDER